MSMQGKPNLELLLQTYLSRVVLEELLFPSWSICKYLRLTRVMGELQDQLKTILASCVCSFPFLLNLA